MTCPACCGCGWVPYFVETVEGRQELAWELCSECEDGSPVPEVSNVR